MADTPATPARTLPTGHPGMGAPETQVGRTSTIGVDLGVPEGKPGENRNPVEHEPDHGLGITIDGDNTSVQRVDSSEEKQAPKPGEEKPGETTEEKPPEQQGILPALPEFDAEKPEVAQAYDKAFLGQDGKSFNMAALSADWSKNVKMDPKTGDFDGGLSESTYKWLETKGIDRATAEAVQAGQVAAIKLQRQEVFTQAGGEDKYTAAVAWARDGSYTKEQQAQFNAALDAGGAQRKDAIDLLMSRFGKANPTRRPSSPERTMGDRAVPAAGNPTGAKPYTSYAEYQKDLRDARTNNDQAKLNETRARLVVSPWYSGNKAR